MKNIINFFKECPSCGHPSVSVWKRLFTGGAKCENCGAILVYGRVAAGFLTLFGIVVILAGLYYSLLYHSYFPFVFSIFIFLGSGLFIKLKVKQ